MQALFSSFSRETEILPLIISEYVVLFIMYSYVYSNYAATKKGFKE